MLTTDLLLVYTNLINVSRDTGPVHTNKDIFQHASFYLFWVSVRSPKRSFSKTLSREDLLENPVFLFSCGRKKTELFENADVTVSIYNPSEYALESLGITRGHFVYLFSDFEYHSIFVWTGIILKTLLVWTRIFLYGKMRCFFKSIRVRVDGATVCRASIQ